MATIPLAPARIISGPGTYTVVDKPEAATQTFGVNAPVYMNTDGDLTICATGATAFEGFATEAATGTTGTRRLVHAPLATGEILMNVYHATPASAVTNENLCDDAGYGITVSGNNCYLNLADTSDPIFKVIRLYPGDAEGDTYGRVICSSIDATSQVRK